MGEYIYTSDRIIIMVFLSFLTFHKFSFIVLDIKLNDVIIILYFESNCIDD